MNAYILAAGLGEAASWFRRRKRKMEFRYYSGVSHMQVFCNEYNCTSLGVHKVETALEAETRLCTKHCIEYGEQQEREARRRQRRDVINQVFRLPSLPAPKEFDFNTRPAPEMYAWMSE